jgi:RNA polymerase sigma-70 factor (ECF subfamily)
LAGKVDKAGNFLQHLAPLQGALEAYCRRSLFDLNSVADVLQSAVATAFRDFDRYAEGTNFRAWVFRYLHLEILNWNRKHQQTRHQDLPADLSIEETWQLAVDEPLLKLLLDDPDAILEQCDDAVFQAIHDLVPLERSVILLHAIGEFKYREMAEILQVPLGTVMSSLARCRLRLRERLVRFGEERGLLPRQAPERGEL